ncbi:OmpA family protein [Saccharopolyspora griseoalba]|uniref:OmpA family protein n=1 Tax=Saccharopolyspora griseoalba TaxID=1431848 RepID=A0ABW2LJC8_9PSEU
MRRTSIKYAAVVITSAAALLAGCGTGQEGGQGQQGQGQGQEGQQQAPPSATPGGMGEGEQGQQGQEGQGQAGQGQAGDVAAAKTELQGKIDELQQSSPITFNPDSADLTDQGRQSVTQVAEMLKQAPQELRFEVSGYTAAVNGSTADAQELSTQRAQTVADQLSQAGITADRMQVAGKGDASGDPEAARRAEIKVM